MRNTYPGVLWLLPILFGAAGGVVSAFIIGMAYRGDWFPHVVVGIAITFITVLAFGLLF